MTLTGLPDSGASTPHLLASFAAIGLFGISVYLLLLWKVHSGAALFGALVAVFAGGVVLATTSVALDTPRDTAVVSAIEKQGRADGLVIAKRDAERIAVRRDGFGNDSSDTNRPIVVLAEKDGTASPFLVSWATKNKLHIVPVTGDVAKALTTQESSKK